MKEILNNKVIKYALFYLGALLLCLLSIWPYLNNGYIMAYRGGGGDDIVFHIPNLLALAEKIKMLDFTPIYWFLGNGNSPITPLFYPQLFTLPAAALIAMSIPAIIAWKIYIFMVTFVTFLVTYFVAKKFFHKPIFAWICGILYIFAIYRIGNIYNRAAIGEVLSCMILPLFLYAIYEILYNKKHGKWYLIPLVFFAVLNAHMVSAFFCAILLAIYLIARAPKIIKNKKLLISLSLAFLFCVLVSLTMTIPQFEQRLIQKFVSPAPWTIMSEMAVKLTNAFQNTIEGRADNWSIGIAFCFVPLFALMFFRKEENKTRRKFFLHTLIALAIFAFFSIDHFFDLKTIGAFYDLFQFPFRLFIIVTLLACFVLTYNIKQFCEWVKFGQIVSFIIVALLLVNSFNVVYQQKDRYLGKKDNGWFWTRTNFTPTEVICTDYYPKDFKTRADFYPKNVKEADGETEYNTKFNGKQFSVEYNGGNDIALIAPAVYYKGYSAKFIADNGKKIKLQTHRTGDAKLAIHGTKADGTGKIVIKYAGTFWQHFSNIITWLSVAFLIIVGHRYRRRERQNEIH
ncbi:MAG: 6-pyruvoyl-tetrahydropterin synthase-related protein [Oscillospiraceae bacterium]|nr:6-pyruvoyl-tetrahydropterin synthase-related protein [Oscillospiraceae bacterium]